MADEKIWGEEARKNAADYLSTDVAESARDEIQAKIERGFATGKPFHVFAPAKKGGVCVISMAVGGGAVNTYPDQETAEKCTKNMGGMWANAAWIE